MLTQEFILSDAHAHLESYEPVALEETIKRAKANGIGIIIANGITLGSSSKTVEIANRYDCIWATVGIHPWYAVRLGNRVASVKDLALNECVVGIGEIGLDFARDPETKESQMELFEEQLKLARALELPVVVHTDGADQETGEAIIRNGTQETGAILQGFTGDFASLKDWLDLEFYISIGWRILKPGNESLAAAIQQIPSEKLLIETDAAARRTISQGLELATLKPIAEKVAEIRKVPIEDIARVTTNNLKKVFRFKGNQ
ncbi:TatD family hydrolase [Thermodesulfobacteriota bacterium]